MEVAKVLTRANINGEISAYLLEVASIRVPTFSQQPLVFFSELKRGNIQGGPYPGHSSMEVANRVLSDLIVFGAAERLLVEPLEKGLFALEEVRVQLGTENADPHDLAGTLSDGTLLHGECFNVSTSFFMSKLNKTRKKLKSTTETSRKLIAFNSDAVEPEYTTKLTWLTHWRIDVDRLLSRFGPASARDKVAK